MMKIFLDLQLFFYKSVAVIKSRRLRWAGHVARMEEGRSAFKILTDKPTGKRLLTWFDIMLIALSCRTAIYQSVAEV